MAIQLMRGTSTQREAATTTTLAAGQPFFETNTQKLYIGNGTTKLSNLHDICYDLNPGSLSVDYGAIFSSDIWCYGNLNVDGDSFLGSTHMSSASLPKVSFQRSNATVVNLLSPTSGGSSTTNIYLPAKAGTMALTSDIPTGALASKNSASGTIKALTSSKRISVDYLGGANIKANSVITIGTISSYDYLYFEGYDNQGSSSNADTACLLIPREKATLHNSTSNSISVTRDGARVRVYITGNGSSTKVNVHVTSYINHLSVWGINRTDSTVSVSVS